jgi:hypothetical protein
VTWDHISARMAKDVTVTSDYISAVMTYAIQCEEHLWNVCTPKRTHLWSCNVVLTSMPRSFERSFFRHSNLNFEHISHLPVPCSPDSPWFECNENIWWRVQITELFILLFSPSSNHFIPLRSKYSLKYPVPKHTQTVIFP